MEESESQASESGKPRRRFRKVVAILGWTVSASIAAPVTALLFQAFKKMGAVDSSAVEMVSVGIPAGMVVAQLVGLRSLGLAGVLIGPFAGFAAGFLGLKLFSWLYGAGVPLHWVALLPVWGALLGVWCAAPQRKVWPIILVAAAAAAVDLASRGTSSLLMVSDSVQRVARGNWRWLIESLVYSPPAILVVLLAKPARRGDHPRA